MLTTGVAAGAVAVGAATGAGAAAGFAPPARMAAMMSFVDDGFAPVGCLVRPALLGAAAGGCRHFGNRLGRRRRSSDRCFWGCGRRVACGSRSSGRFLSADFCEDIGSGRFFVFHDAWDPEQVINAQEGGSHREATRDFANITAG